ncbi:DegT/DnrJ/EryC1/StrS aminotransferase domain-containing protein [Desulfonema limicola]|uniref:DegT/DnrJ/EryC1/StrS aminotransferase domain-containing protein n=1 Tax=Desulfonema limicola TaxID=45656 RepID=A0A975GHZ8_9BACT|nr:DegT/DnrJ/EryC1/StrS family aminotransferase [Desulfonema limicola]QTA81884.1 DegT/DnrJ/EryC1/StrS aminotransferase domain-containing protein [Desulfonema limicola]
MHFVDLEAQQKRIVHTIEANIQKVLHHGKYIMGPEVEELETRLAKYAGVKHAIACASGTDALLLALMAYNTSPGHGILTTPFTFIASSEVISLLGGVPVFVDVDPVTFNIDPEKLEQTIHSYKTSDISLKGIIPVDIFGIPADYDAINAIAEKHGLFVIEDAAQSFGAEYKGKKSCALADIACTSFFPAKPLGCYGDGGMCFTDNDNLAEILGSIRLHGKGSFKYDNVRIGINGRLDTLQAAILLAKFEIFPEEIKLRNQAAQRYNSLLSSQKSIIPPQTPEGIKSAWAQYSILLKDEDHRSQIQENLKNAGIPSAVYYPRPLHLQSAFVDLNYKQGDFPVSEEICKRILSIPMHPYLTYDDQKKVINAILNKESENE